MLREIASTKAGVFFLLFALLFSAGSGAAETSPAPASAESAGKPEATAAVPALPPVPAIPETTLALIRQLYDPAESVRAQAAAQLRELFRKDPEALQTSAGKAHWEAALRKLTPTSTDIEAGAFLPNFVAPAPKRESIPANLNTSDGVPVKPTPLLFGTVLGSGDTMICIWRLDYSWSVHANFFWQSRLLRPDTPPELIRKFFDVYVKPPEHYTGVWTTWYVNGQKANEITFKDGQYDGVFTAFHDNGRKSYEQHYENGTCSGADTGWNADGTKSYEGRYRDGKQDGIWQHWHPNGKLWVKSEYRNGKLNGRDERWFPDGKQQSAVDYADGVQNGVDQCWDEAGDQLWLRQYLNGNLVSP